MKKFFPESELIINNDGQLSVGTRNLLGCLHRCQTAHGHDGQCHSFNYHIFKSQLDFYYFSVFE